MSAPSAPGEARADAPPGDRVLAARAIAPAPAGAYAVVKRGSDLALAAVLLVVLAPLLLAVAIAVRLDSSGPALFRQRRSGRGCAEFVILKFRTMKTGTPDLASHLIQDSAAGRITGIGGLLRRTSLDELPQLWNVLRGDMALIGPRPALYNQDDLIALRRAAGVDALRPGVTGWAQVNGRDELPIVEKVRLDREYLERCGPALDAQVLLRTLLVLFTGRGVN